MRTLYKQDGFCECYITDENKLIFEINVRDIDLQYVLSGHPYEPVLNADCNIPAYSFSVHGGLWFPSLETSAEEWGKFCNDLSEEVVKRFLCRLFESHINTEDVFIGKYIQAPNKAGCFVHRRLWYVYETDEHANSDISGPFDSNDIIGALSVMLHLEDKFENYKYSDAARNTYIYTHYRSMGELQ